MNENNLKVTISPCPFCGCSTASLDQADAMDRCGDEDAWVECPDCLTRGPVATQGCAEEDVDIAGTAIALWNTRTGGLKHLPPDAPLPGGEPEPL